MSRRSSSAARASSRVTSDDYFCRSAGDLTACGPAGPRRAGAHGRASQAAEESRSTTSVFRAAYGVFKTHRGERAEVEYVRVLHLAASTMESSVERALAVLLATGEPFDYAAVRALAAPEPSRVPDVKIRAGESEVLAL